jgi:GT2 family glycosyltransferase
MTRIAVVILNWNGSGFLSRFLPSVCRYSTGQDVNVIVVDNGSSDDSISLLKQQFPEVEVIAFPENFGFALGYLKALRMIDAQYFVLLNSDVEVTEGWLDPMRAAMDVNPSLGACMPKMMDYNRRAYFEYAGAAGGYLDVLGYPFCRGRMLSQVEKDKGQYNDRKQVFWATGACLFIRSEAYFHAGELDGDFFAHMEEIDLCWRLLKTGYTIECIPQSEVYHVGGGTLPNNNPRKLYLNYRNNLFLLFKNLEGVYLVPVILVRMILDGLSAFSYLLNGKSSFFRAVIRAHLSFYRHFPSLIRKRKELNKLTRKNRIREIYPGSILWNFFVRKKRTFDQLDWRILNRPSS